MTKKLEGSIEKMKEAMLQGNGAKYAEVFSENGIIFMDDNQMVHGRPQIEAQMQNLMDLLGPITFELQPDDSWEIPGEIVEKGKFYHYYPEQSESFYQGQYIAIWREIGDEFYLEKFFSLES